MRAAPLAPPTSKSAKQAEKRVRDREVQDSLVAASPVPESFDEAVSFACGASLQAADAGTMLQTMYFNTGESAAEVSGEFGNCLPFAEQVVKKFAEVIEEGKVKAVFTDMGAQSLANSRWQPLPEKLELVSLPRGTVIDRANDDLQMKVLYESLLKDVAIIVFVAARQSELRETLRFLKELEECGIDVPLVFVNPRLVSDFNTAAGTLLRQFRVLERKLTPVFHLEQYDPAESKDLNSCVVTRVWPKPFSSWEDNPNDPESENGYFLLDLNDESPPQFEELDYLLTQSRNISAAIDKNIIKQSQPKKRLQKGNPEDYDRPDPGLARK